MKIKSIIFSIICSSIVGGICIIAPPYILEGCNIVRYNAPLFPVIATAIENIHLFTSIILLLTIYGILGYLTEIRWFIAGPASMLLFPVVLLLEIIKSPVSHNLWPLELGLYAFLDLPAIVGLFIGNRMRKHGRLG